MRRPFSGSRRADRSARLIPCLVLALQLLTVPRPSAGEVPPPSITVQPQQQCTTVTTCVEERTIFETVLSGRTRRQCTGSICVDVPLMERVERTICTRWEKRTECR